MKRLALVAALVLIAAPAAAAVPVAQAPGYAVCTLTTAAATVCAAPGGGTASLLVGVANNGIAAQTATVTCYDNPAAASGPIAASIGALGATQVIAWPQPGRLLANGLTCQASAAPTGAGVEIYVR